MRQIADDINAVYFHYNFSSLLFCSLLTVTDNKRVGFYFIISGDVLIKILVKIKNKFRSENCYLMSQLSII